MCVYYFDYSNINNIKHMCKPGVMSLRCSILTPDYYCIEMDFFDGHKETVKLDSFQSFTADDNDVL